MSDELLRQDTGPRAAIQLGTVIADGKPFVMTMEAVVQTFAYLAKRGSGKTYAALVVAEQMIGHGAPVVVLDPVGVTWGLRSSADGKQSGLPVLILGGDHADAPLEASAGAVVADFLVETRQSMVLDMSRFSKTEQRRFVTDFAERLYRVNRAPLHVVLDEADMFAPQGRVRGEERMLGAINDLVRRGRARGIGVSLVSQRASVIHKDVLTQIEVLVTLRTTGPHDIAAIRRWVEHNGTDALRKNLASHLSSLPIGHAWVWSPGWLERFELVAVRRRTTFDSSATPKTHLAGLPPVVMAPVDLALLRERMAATIERVETSDPKALKKLVGELQADLVRAREQTTAQVEVPYLSVEDLREVRFLRTAIEDHTVAIRGLYERWISLDAKLIESYSVAVKTPPDTAYVFARELPPATPREPALLRPANGAGRWRGDAPPSARPKKTAAIDDGKGGKLNRPEAALLRVLAQRKEPTSDVQLAILSGYRRTSSSFANAIGRLRTLGLAIGGPAGRLATDLGLERAGPQSAAPTGEALLSYWEGKLKRAERSVLDTLYRERDRVLTLEDISKLTGYSITSSSLHNAVGRVRTLGLATGGKRDGYRIGPMFRA